MTVKSSVVKTLTVTNTATPLQGVTKTKKQNAFVTTQTVRVQVFRDINSNGVFDAGDLPVAGSALELVKLDGGRLVLDNGVTGANGMVAFVTNLITSWNKIAVTYPGAVGTLAELQVGANGLVPNATIPVIVTTLPLSTTGAIARTKTQTSAAPGGVDAWSTTMAKTASRTLSRTSTHSPTRTKTASSTSETQSSTSLTTSETQTSSSQTSSTSESSTTTSESQTSSSTSESTTSETETSTSETQTSTSETTTSTSETETSTRRVLKARWPLAQN